MNQVIDFFFSFHIICQKDIAFLEKGDPGMAHFSSFLSSILERNYVICNFFSPHSLTLVTYCSTIYFLTVHCCLLYTD